MILYASKIILKKKLIFFSSLSFMIEYPIPATAIRHNLARGDFTLLSWKKKIYLDFNFIKI